MIRDTLIPCLLLVIGSSTLAAAELQLVPEPREIRRTEAGFLVAQNSAIQLAPALGEEYGFAAQSLQEELAAVTGRSAPLLRREYGKKQEGIFLGSLADPRIRETLRSRGVDPDGIGPEGYALEVTPQQVIVAGADAAGLYYGVQTLRQLFTAEPHPAIPGVRIRDWPSLRYRGMQVDLARGPVPTLAYMKRIIATIAEFKLNQIYMYMEDSFQAPDQPLIGVLSDVFTVDEWKEVVAFARRHHVDVVPAQNLCGHLRKVLRFEQYSEFAERPHGHVVAPDNPKTHAFAKKMLDDLLAIFPGKFYLIGFDETFELGRGQSAQRVRDEGFATVYTDYLLRVRGMLRPKGKEVIFWGDMMMRHPEKLASLPKDLIVMPWSYFPEKSHAPWLDPFVKNGFRILPGCWVGGSGNLMIHDYQQAAKNISGLIDESRKAGTLGISNTVWGDDGEALFAPNWWSLVYGAACSWEPAPADVKRFNEKYDWVFYRNTDSRFADAIWQLGNINEIIRPTGVGRSWGLENFGGTQTDTFWRNPFSAEGREEIQKALPVASKVRQEAEAAYTVFARDAARARRNADTLAFYRFAALRLDALGMRWQYMDEISRRYTTAYSHRNDPDYMLYKFDMYDITGTNGRLQDLRDYTTRLRILYADAFLSENRPTWLPNVLQLYDRQSALWQDRIALFYQATRDFKTRRPIPSPEEIGLLPVEPDQPQAPLLTNDEVPAPRSKPATP